MSCCFRYLSLLARRTLAVVVLGYKVRNCYALSVTHFIRRPLRGYAVTPLRILYPTRVVSWSTSKLSQILSCHNGEMQSLMYSSRWSMWLKWPKTALLRCLISSFIDSSSDSLATSLFFTKSYQCPVDVKYLSLVRHMKGLEFRNISFQQCLSTSQKHTRAVTGHAKLGGTSIDTGHQTHHRRGQLERSSLGFPAEITIT